MERLKIFYILTEFNTYTHFSYNFEFLSEIKKNFDIRVLVEKGGNAAVKTTEYERQKYSFFPVRLNLSNELISLSKDLPMHEGITLGGIIIEAWFLCETEKASLTNRSKILENL